MCKSSSQHWVTQTQTLLVFNSKFNQNRKQIKTTNYNIYLHNITCKNKHLIGGKRKEHATKFSYNNLNLRYTNESNFKYCFTTNGFKLSCVSLEGDERASLTGRQTTEKRPLKWRNVAKHPLRRVRETVAKKNFVRNGKRATLPLQAARRDGARRGVARRFVCILLLSAVLGIKTQRYEVKFRVTAPDLFWLATVTVYYIGKLGFFCLCDNQTIA